MLRINPFTVNSLNNVKLYSVTIRRCGLVYRSHRTLLLQSLLLSAPPPNHKIMSIAIFDVRWFKCRLNFTSTYTIEANATWQCQWWQFIAWFCHAAPSNTSIHHFITNKQKKSFIQPSTLALFFWFADFRFLIFFHSLDRFELFSRNKLHRTLRSFVLNIRLELAFVCFDETNVGNNKTKFYPYRNCKRAIIRKREGKWMWTTKH